MKNTSTPEVPEGPMPVLWILEDDSDIGFVLEMFFQGEGFETSLFATAKSFRLALETALPDVFLMDVRLPDGNGVDLCAELKSDVKSKHIPVLMMSAHARIEQINSCGFNGFISKPFELNQILELVKSQLG